MQNLTECLIYIYWQQLTWWEFCQTHNFMQIYQQSDGNIWVPCFKSIMIRNILILFLSNKELNYNFFVSRDIYLSYLEFRKNYFFFYKKYVGRRREEKNSGKKVAGNVFCWENCLQFFTHFHMCHENAKLLFIVDKAWSNLVSFSVFAPFRSFLLQPPTMRHSLTEHPMSSFESAD